MIVEASWRLKHMKLCLLGTQEDLTVCTILVGQHQVKESVNVTFDDTKLPNIQTEDATEKLKFNNLSDPDSDDDATQLEVVADGNIENNDGDHGDGGGIIDFNGESTDTGEES